MKYENFAKKIKEIFEFLFSSYKFETQKVL